tara:strand:- start:41 stop:286 length:246 start_codon:yes stop_codon:yes gene_type:complete
MSSIFAELPNDLVMKIIKQADGAIDIHKPKFNIVLEELLEPDHIAEFYFDWSSDYNYGNTDWLATGNGLEPGELPWYQGGW